MFSWEDCIYAWGSKAFSNPHAYVAMWFYLNSGGLISTKNLLSTCSGVLIGTVFSLYDAWFNKRRRKKIQLQNCIKQIRENASCQPPHHWTLKSCISDLISNEHFFSNFTDKLTWTCWYTLTDLHIKQRSKNICLFKLLEPPSGNCELANTLDTT